MPILSWSLYFAKSSNIRNFGIDKDMVWKAPDFRCPDIWGIIADTKRQSHCWPCPGLLDLWYWATLYRHAPAARFALRSDRNLGRSSILLVFCPQQKGCLDKGEYITVIDTLSVVVGFEYCEFNFICLKFIYGPFYIRQMFFDIRISLFRDDSRRCQGFNPFIQLGLWGSIVFRHRIKSNSGFPYPRENITKDVIIFSAFQVGGYIRPVFSPAKKKMLAWFCMILLKQF